MKTTQPYTCPGTDGRLARRLMAAKLRAAQDATRRIVEESRSMGMAPAASTASGPLHEMLRDGATLPLPRALRILLDLSLALARQIGHGESVGRVGTRNVWISPTGQAELLDPMTMTMVDRIKVDSEPRAINRSVVRSLAALLRRMAESPAGDTPVAVRSFLRRLSLRHDGEEGFASLLELAEVLRSALIDAGWIDGDALASRDRQRGDVHESYFYRGLELIHGDHLLKGLSLWAALGRLPEEAGGAYARQMEGQLSPVLRSLAEELVHRTPSAPELWKGLAALEALYALAESLGVSDVSPLAQEIFVLACRRIPSRTERHRLCRDFMRRHPRALTVAHRCFELARALGMLRRSRATALVLARRFHQAGLEDKAFELAHEARQDERLRRRTDVLLRAIGAAHSKLELELIDFEERARKALAQGRRYDVLSAARNLCDRFPRSVDCRIHLADIQENLGQTREATESLLHAGALSLEACRLAQAAEIYGRVLRSAPDSEPAHEQLFAVLSLLGRLPEGPIAGPYRRLATLLAQGLDDPAAHEFDSVLRAHGFHPEELCAHLDLASRNGCRRVSALFDVTLGAFALAHEKHDLARQYFVTALDASPRPTEILDRIEAVPDHDLVLPLRGLMALKRLCATRSPEEVAAPDFRKRFRRAVLRQTSSGPGMKGRLIG